MEKYNLALQEQVKEYGLSLVEERNEKKERITKHETLQKEYVGTAKKLYLAIGMSIVLMLAAGVLLRLYLSR